METAIRIAKMKIDSSYANDIQGAVKEVIGSCQSIGMTIEGKPAKDIYSEVSAGKYDEHFK